MFRKDKKKEPGLVVVRVKAGHLALLEREAKLKSVHDKLTKSLTDVGFDMTTIKILVVDEDTEITKVI